MSARLLALPRLLALALIVCATKGKIQFRIKDCTADPARKAVTLLDRHVNPTPVTIPGDVTVQGSMAVHRNVTGSIQLKVNIQRYLGFFWLTVPCFSGVGSCEYPDFCKMLSDAYGDNTGCPPQFLDSGIPCTCPFLADTYTLKREVFTIPALSGVWRFLASGDYKVEGRLVDTATGQELGCQHMEVTIVDGHPPCNGFLCSIFG